ncbi:MAG: hypothetical protein A2295_02295 [Candidatus Jacksonbacteria bacterium RIFOXYB2_FULL_44_15]|nr:MAG: hypothetical protein A2295_02295 [Candidatus Jacksonbacteria bacterium RIFOXYB2_FULL_44_15]OGY82189.1 MAG: hypothetical protein A2550_05800 [Candidatus Jacksonbacteria bacterium RIFOXYD2_FULL_43_21]HCE48725.1 hypothetical protein [Candidatus Jacksonbacteria bacterium]
MYPENVILPDNMLKYGLKMWDQNYDLFSEAVALFNDARIDFIELYYSPETLPDYQKLALLKDIPITIHATHDFGFREFIFKDAQLEIWRNTQKLADFFAAPYIVVHAGLTTKFSDWAVNLRQIDDPRIIIENMAAYDLFDQKMYGHSLVELQEIHSLKPICFDFEKAVKAACSQNIPHQLFVEQCIKILQPFYFHLSGGDKDSPRDEHLNLWESNIDFAWIKKILLKLAQKKKIYLVFETPKIYDDLNNDLKNINYFKKI